MAAQNAAIGSSPFRSKCVRSKKVSKAVGSSRKLLFAKRSFSRNLSSTSVNEFFLFHGTNPSAAQAICQSGFNVDLSGSNKGALYGPGVYLAESSAKADEYAGDDKEGIYKGLFAMLLCRASLGNPIINEEVQPDKEEIHRLLQAHDKHSVVGDREKARGTYREFVVRDGRGVYPAYVIIYRRKKAKK
ncbi:unnamed protein product [Prorocentrum cordatum]|uniref:Poly [ADP-ribose] polymerase n=1 Tax=Prorocentrum cordatum TaxID=2364126 RepID=A0ABN9S841_9DINO|nr:unnamed protein product [Polarella glacialis]